jgi:NADP-reducing hydrogenase subunit HndD
MEPKMNQRSAAVMAEQHLTIDGHTVAFTPGQTILEAARAVNIWIPTLCYLKDATPTGACRICLVEVEGARTLQPACATPAAAGMKVQTESKQVVAARRMVLELLIASGNHNCAVCNESNGDWSSFQDLCPVWGDCKLQDLAFRYQVRGGHFDPAPGAYPTEMANPLIIRDFSRCILCGRCVQACNEVQVNRAISHGYRGTRSKIVAAGDRPLIHSECVFCGECIQACPVGALVEKKSRYQWRPWKETTVRTTCPYCGVGCQLLLHVKDGGSSRSRRGGGRAQPGPAVRQGPVRLRFHLFRRAAETPLDPGKGRLPRSLLGRGPGPGGQVQKIIAESGPDALAGVSCARSINEDSYQMQKLFRAVFKTNNIDHCART